MTSIGKLAYATLLAFTALSFAPSLVSAQESARGNFTLTHAVRWGNAKVPAGDYEFFFDPNAGEHMLRLTKVSGNPAGYMLLVPSVDEAKSSDPSQLVLKATPDGSYVNAMQLPRCGITLYFPVPSHTTEKQMAKAAIAATALGQ